MSDNAQLITVMHSAGVNCRYLGLLRASVTAPWPRECILLEMIARCLRTYVLDAGVVRCEVRRLSNGPEPLMSRLSVVQDVPLADASVRCTQPARPGTALVNRSSQCACQRRGCDVHESSVRDARQGLT